MVERDDLPFALNNLARIPEALRANIKRDYWETYKIGMGHYKHEGRARANTFLREAAEHLQDIPANYLDDEDTLREYAESKARLCKDLFRRAGDRFKGFTAIERFLNDEHIDEPQQDGDRYLSRVFCASWWLRALRKSLARQVESVALRIGYVHARKQVYCSDFAIERRRNQRHRLRDYANSLELVNEVGDCFKLSELINKSTANPEVRRAELMTRIRGMEEVSQRIGSAAVFLTMTAPSKYHASSKKYNGATPREVQAYFNKQWSKIRAEWGRHDLHPFGVRVVEPHQDGCPHWHMLLFIEPDRQRDLISIARRYSFEIDGKEKGAYKARFKVEFINRHKGSAAAYVAKYISKNIDGFALDYVKDGDEIVPIPAAEAAERIDAWASLWGIRQFQFIGSPPVTIWRELRRISDNDDQFDYAPAEMARRAADCGDWAVFTLRYVRAAAEGNPLELWKDDEQRIGIYGDLLPPKNVGVKCGEDFALTRWHTWELLSEHSEPWTGVNNCTHSKNIIEEAIKISKFSGEPPPIIH